ncbi:hypothetical protein EYF80_046754 [Liparis tanakae]|uniref:Uncharacterized protein n=1 Tax=Liparis tanakae TaxID=230148 RepID=A0A4Z2FQP9_9TELE|nr:hypothetical protein EYF80_046754 [Liparis tanakae]
MSVYVNSPHLIAGGEKTSLRQCLSPGEQNDGDPFLSNHDTTFTPTSHCSTHWVEGILVLRPTHMWALWPLSVPSVRWGPGVIRRERESEQGPQSTVLQRSKGHIGLEGEVNKGGISLLS